MGLNFDCSPGQPQHNGNKRQRTRQDAEGLRKSSIDYPKKAERSTVTGLIAGRRRLVAEASGVRKIERRFSAGAPTGTAVRPQHSWSTRLEF
jgi:hypothetical protein